MAITIDTQDFEKFIKSINGIKEQMDNILEQAVLNVANRLLALVKKKTPVGVYGDYVQFTTSDGTFVSFKRTVPKTGGTLRRGWHVGSLKHSGNTYEVEVYNNVEYAPYVENGHRTANHTGWVPGVFMLKLSEEEIREEAETIVNQKITELLND